MRLYLIALAAIISTPAMAFDIDTRCTHSKFFGMHCHTSISEPLPPDPAEVAEDERLAALRLAKWTAFCQPKLVRGMDGLGRYRYAHEGCDLGRDE